MGVEFKRGLLAWSPTMEGDFHVPRMFGEIIFGGRAVP
jgi:hypothetical protein